jgi:hypothetical protein
MNIGDKLGTRTVISEKFYKIGKNGGRKVPYIKVQCDCGDIAEVELRGFRNGRSHRCRTCCKNDIRIDIKGKRYGKLVAIQFIGKRTKKQSLWECKCDCGNTYYEQSYFLEAGVRKSCGCEHWTRGNKNSRYTGCGDLSGHFWCLIKKGAETRNLDFEILIEDAWNQFIKQDKKCALTGIEINLSPHSGDKRRASYIEQTASLDRIDSSKGYTLYNIQWLHKDINLIKQAYEESYFIKMCQMVADYSRNEKDDLNYEEI